MSHFTVLVIGNEPEEQLKPFQENNCDDCPEEYLEFNDTTQEHKESYAKDFTEVVEYPDGAMVSTYDDRFKNPNYNFMGGRNKETNPEYIYLYPVIEVPVNVLYKTFEEYMTDYCGERFHKDQNAWGYWENPNAKWDWHQLGGRWCGFFKLKDNPKSIKFINDTHIKMLAKRYNTNEDLIKKKISIFTNKKLTEQEKYNLDKNLPVVCGGYYLDKEIIELIKPRYMNAQLGTLGLQTSVPEEG